MAVDRDQLLAECEDQREYFQRIGNVPQVLESERQGTAARVQDAAA